MSILLSEDEKDNLIIRLRTLVEEYRKEIAELEAQRDKALARAAELASALEKLMDDYQYEVCFDRHYEAARKVLKQEKS